MQHYKLLGGQHYQGGKRYKAGDIIESDIDLAAKYTNKFEPCEPYSAVSTISTKETPKPLPPQTDPIEVPEPKDATEEEYTIKYHCRGKQGQPGRYVVLDSQGNRVHPGTLTKSEAQELIYQK